VLPGDAQIRDVRRDQDYRYTLIERGGDDTVDVHTIGSIIDYLYAPENPDPVLDRLRRRSRGSCR
jgi:mannitol 2-dehydrogenase